MPTQYVGDLHPAGPRHTGNARVVEEQDIVYMRADRAVPPAGPDPLPPGADQRPVFSLDINATLLFRFSALTCNAHRIHYDRAYARIEGHRAVCFAGIISLPRCPAGRWSPRAS